MAVADPGKEAKHFHLDVPCENRPFFLKGAAYGNIPLRPWSGSTMG